MSQRHSLIPLISLLLVIVFAIPVDRALFGLELLPRIILAILASISFIASLALEPRHRRQHYLTLATTVAILIVAPINTDTSTAHMLSLAIFFTAVLVVPWLMLKGSTLNFNFWPRKLDWIDIGYTLLSIPLAWGGIGLYFYLSPEVPFNWVLPAQPDNEQLFRLFMGINAVGIWDELFFVNIGYAIIRALFPYRIANPAQAVLYTAVLYDMTFTGWGPVFVYILALTQGAMYERSKVLLYVLIVHLIVDYFLFQAIVEAYYPGLDVWWH